MSVGAMLEGEEHVSLIALRKGSIPGRSPSELSWAGQ